MSETKAPWSPARAVLPPDPNGHNRALDRVAAEHLREVAPGLAASPAPPQPEPAKANAPRKGSKAWAIQEACRIVGIAFHGIAEYDEASDCFCSESRDQDYRNGGHALAFVEAAVREKLAREKSPAPEATGEHKAKRLAARLRMNAPPTNYGDLLREAADYLETIPETERQMRAWRKMAENPREPVECKPEATGEMAAPAVVASVYCTFRDMLGEIDSKTTWMRASLTELEEEYVKARTRAREAEGREAKWRRELSAACELSERAREIVVSALNQPPEHYYDKHDNGEWSAEHIAFAIRSLFRERDEAREQRDAAGAEVAEYDELFALQRTRMGEATKLWHDAGNDPSVLPDLGDLLAWLMEWGAAANARAEEAERNYDRLRDISLCRRQFPDGVVPGGTEECARGWHDWYEKENAARLRAEAERDGALTEANDLRLRVERLVEGAAKLTERAEEAEEELRLADFRVKSAESRSDDFAARLAVAEAEVKRLRLAYDDPSLDATDGAHPAWWRGNDAGVAGAVRIVNEALDEALPLAGCVGGADLERVRQRIAALRERAERLERAGDPIVAMARYYAERFANAEALFAAWAAAKGTK